MKAVTRLAIMFLLCPIMLNANTYWQTTRNGSSTGQCQLETNTIRMTISPFSIDVEEEAVVSTRGTIWSGDAATLEIVGTFTLTKGSSVRSMLLWNGQQILKAKLKDRYAADSAYQAVVNRQRPRDPALIEYLGNSQYQFRIFPVALNGSRKIRILYTIPLQVAGEGPQFQIATAFTVGAQQTPTQIPVEIRRSGQETGDYVLTYGEIRKTIQFGATYQLPYAAFVTATYNSWGTYTGTSARSLLITRDTTVSALAYVARLEKDKVAGYYTAVFATPPDTIMAALDELSPYGSTSLEAKVIAGSKAYITDFNGPSCLGVYIKSTSAWDNAVYWTLYNSDGKAAVQCRQTFTPVSDSLSQAMLPLVWGAKYSLVEGLGSLGAAYGFVDYQMSLLALESDSMNRVEAAQYAESGVPALRPEEIVIKPSQMPSAPGESVIFEYGSVGVTSMVNAITQALTVQLLANRMVRINLGDLKSGTVKAVLMTLDGKIVQTWNDVRLSSGSADLRLPDQARGCMVLRVFAGSKVLQKRITIVR